MTKHHAPKDFAQPAASDCRVAELAIRFGLAEKDWNKLDSCDESVIEAEAINDVMMRAMTDMAAFTQPTSPLGALFEVLIASQELDCVYAHTADDALSVARGHVVKLEAALWGVRRFLEARFDISADEIGGGYMMTESTSFAGKLKAALAKPAAAELRQAAE